MKWRVIFWTSSVLATGSLGLWVLSYFYVCGVIYQPPSGSTWELDGSAGAIVFSYQQNLGSKSGAKMYWFPMDPFGPVIGAYWKKFGFDWEFAAARGRFGRTLDLVVPFWCFACVLDAIAWIARRKKSRERKGFPIAVEPPRSEEVAKTGRF